MFLATKKKQKSSNLQVIIEKNNLLFVANDVQCILIIVYIDKYNVKLIMDSSHERQTILIFPNHF